MRSFFARRSVFPAFLLASVVLVLLTVPLASAAQNPEPGMAKPAGVPSYRAGGESITIPQPTNDLVEVGSDSRVIMEVFVPDQNRLLAAFTLSDDLPKLRSGGNSALSKYSLVEVPRRGEFADFSAKDFNELAEGASKEFGAVLNSSVKESEDGLNRRMKALDLDDAKIILDKPVQLGSFFSKQDAYGVGMIMPISKDGNTTKMVVGIIFLRARNRMLFAYVYATYKDQETVKWMRKTTEEWADAILKSNEQ
jgi:hypothetical protein